MRVARRAHAVFVAKGKSAVGTLASLRFAHPCNSYTAFAHRAAPAIEGRTGDTSARDEMTTRPRKRATSAKSGKALCAQLRIDRKISRTDAFARRASGSFVR
jgi:hypothetical protein